MARYILILVLFSLTFSKILTQLHNQLNSILLNDLDSDCMNEKNIDFNATIKNASNCIFKPFENILTDQWKVSKLQDAVVILMCKNKLFHKCSKELRDTLNPCLSQESQEIFTQIHQVVEAFFDSLCVIDVKTFLDTNCTKPNFQDWHRGTDSDCKINFNNAELIHLKDLISLERCEKYKNLIDCKIRSLNQCPRIQRLYRNLLTNMYQASPCVN